MPQLSLEYVAATEQHSPAGALRLAEQALGGGFDGVFLTDRFQPWLPAHGHAPSSWTMAGALATRGGTLTVAAVPGYRTHPAMIAQASMTVSALRGGDHTLVLSAGDAIDEHVVGGYWPEAHERVARLVDAAEAIRKLHSTVRRRSDVRHTSAHHPLETSRLWFAEDTPRPRMLLWAASPVTARRAAAVADGIVVTAASEDRVRAVVRAAREGAASAGRDPRSVSIAAYLQLCWAPTEAQAEASAVRDWPMAGVRFPRGDIRSPFDVEHLAASVTVADVRSRIRVSADPAVHAADIAQLAALGADTVFVHNVAREQAAWIDVFADRIRPGVV